MRAERYDNLESPEVDLVASVDPRWVHSGSVKILLGLVMMSAHVLHHFCCSRGQATNQQSRVAPPHGEGRTHTQH